MPSYYRDFRSQRALAIQTLERAGFGWLDIMRIENGLSRQGLDREQGGEILAEIADAASRNPDREPWEAEAVKRC